MSYKSIFLSLIITFLAVNSIKAQNKELCEVELEGKNYTLHLVELGDNLFRISQKYNTTILDIWKENPAIIDSVIIPGQVLKILLDSKNIKQEASPLSSTQQDKQVEISAEKVDSAHKETIPKLKKENHDVESDIVYHEVGRGQTLFAISRMYNVGVAEIMEWNGMSDYNIQPGQQLIVSPHGSIKITELKETEDTIVGQEVVVTEIVPTTRPVKRKVAADKQQDILQQKFNDMRMSETLEKMERGSASWMKTGNSSFSKSYVALHKTAPIGTVMRVKNLVNRRYVFVKIVGKLPNTGDNKNLQIRLSETAKKSLVLVDKKTLVQLQYYLE